jgi:hypothetical protein
MIDVLYLAHQRKEFTAESLYMLCRNTPWDIARLSIYTDGAGLEVPRAAALPRNVYFDCRSYGGPVAIMNQWLADDSRPHAKLFAKIDNDVILPPGWLQACHAVMNAHPELDLLGIEPPLSRTPAAWAVGQPPAIPEDDPVVRSLVNLTCAPRYARCDAIGGIGMMRARAFATHPPMQPHGPNGVGGFTDWQWRHKDVVKGWIVPPLPCFLLDRLPIEPWVSLSREYIAQGWQRPWMPYPHQSSELWNWWRA